MMIAVVGDYSIVAEFSKKSVYIFASVIALVFKNICQLTTNPTRDKNRKT
jgi:hypothetical protein